MNENEMLQEDEISLFDLWEKLREGWLAVVGGATLGIAGAVLAIFLIPPKYEAVAVVEVGQIGLIQRVLTFGDNQPNARLRPVQPVESPVQAIERMRTAAFLERVFERAGAHGQLAVQVIKATATEASPLIELKVAGSSPEHLARIGESAVIELVQSEEPLARPWIELIHGEIRLAEERIARVDKDVSDSWKLVLEGASKSNRAGDAALLAAIKERQQQDLSVYRQTIAVAQAALAATRPAHAIEPFSVGGVPVSPKRNLLFALGTIGGLLAGVIWVFVSDAWRRARAARKASCVGSTVQFN
jgi:hypothetical protein